MEKLITNLQQTYCTRNSYYMMSIINQFREKAPDLCINYLFEEVGRRTTMGYNMTRSNNASSKVI